MFETPDTKSVESVDENGKTVVVQELTGETTKSVRYSIAELKAFKALGEAIERIEALEAQVALLKA